MRASSWRGEDRREDVSAGPESVDQDRTGSWIGAQLGRSERDLDRADGRVLSEGILDGHGARKLRPEDVRERGALGGVRERRSVSREMDEADPGRSAILIDAFGAGGNVLAAVLTTP